MGWQDAPVVSGSWQDAPLVAPERAKASPQLDANGFRTNNQLDSHGYRIGTNGAELQPTTADLAMGARQVIDAGAQMLTRGLEKIPGISDFMRGQRQNVEQVNQQALNDYKARYAPDSRPESALFRGGGQALVTGPMLAMKAATALPAVMGQGAAMGGASGALTPIYNAGSDFWTQKAKQAGEGAALGAATAGAFNLAGRAINPSVSPDVQAVMDEGVTPTPGQILGGPFKRMEEKSTSFPILGDAIKSAQTKGLNEYNVAVYNRILGNIGQKYDGPAGQEGIAAVGNKLSDAYDSALARSAPSEVTDAFRAKMGQLAAMVPEAKRADFTNVVNSQLKVAPGNTITPSVAKDAESEFGRLIRQYKGSSVADEREFAGALQQAQANLRQLVADNNPQVAQELQNINKGWADLVQLENAASSTKVARQAGLITPADQLRGIKKSDYSIRDRRFARGEMPNQDFAQAADAVLSNRYPDSGSIGRLLANSLTGSALGGGAVAEPFIGGSALAGAGLLSLPYLPGGRQAVAALLARRPQGAEGVSDLVKTLAPYLAAAAPAGLLAAR